MADNAIFGVNSILKIAKEKGREYILIKNNSIKNSWALEVVINKNKG